MTSHDYSFSEALQVVSCSESTLRRKLKEDGSRLGATKLKRGWRIPVTTLEALGVLPSVSTDDGSSVTGRDRSDDRSPNSADALSQEVARLRTENAMLRERVSGLEALLEERGRVVALLEARPRHWWQRIRTRHDDGADEGAR